MMLFSGFEEFGKSTGLMPLIKLINEVTPNEYFSAEAENYIESDSDDFAFLTDEIESPVTRYPVYERETENQALELSDFETIITYLSWLDKRTQFIIIHTLGLFGNIPQSEEQIGRILGISGGRVFQLYHKGIRKLKSLCHKLDWYMSKEEQARRRLK